MSSPPIKITKAEQALLRELSEEAWNAELYDHLLELYEDFGRWGDDAMSALDLVEKIREFHEGVSQELYKHYALLDPAVSVARAVALGLVSEAALGESLSRKLARQIQAYRDMKDD